MFKLFSKKKRSKDQVFLECELPVGVIDRIGETEFKSQSSYSSSRQQKVARLANRLFKDSDFKGTEVLEFGPGHFGFSLYARARGASVTAFEYDATFAAIGRDLDLRVIENDFCFNDFSSMPKPNIIFAKGVFNAYRYDEQQFDLIKRNWYEIFDSASKVFFTTVNKGADDSLLEERLEMAQNLFLSLGCSEVDISEDIRRLYALNYTGVHIWVKGLEINNLVNY